MQELHIFMLFMEDPLGQFSNPSSHWLKKIIRPDWSRMDEKTAPFLKARSRQVKRLFKLVYHEDHFHYFHVDAR